MFFYLSKILWFFAVPSNLLATLIAAGFAAILLGRRRLGLWTGIGATFLLLVIGLGPVGLWLLLPLEERFPIDRDMARPVAGIVVLGGALSSALTAARDQLVTGEAGERIIALSDLARRYPQAKLVFSGGSDLMVASTGLAEADLVARHIDVLGIAPGRLILESQSRTTWENAVETRRMVTPQPSETWLLVTSAWHMPRAVGAFRQAGFPVTAYPVDFLTRGPDDMLTTHTTITAGLARMDLASKEWVGLLFYWLSGRSDSLLPGPSAPAPAPASATLIR
jgi:uncharacterized SAM-binding protein YcdF (DUF218 family)